VASTLLAGVDHGTDGMLRPLEEAVAADRPEDAMPGLIWVLVAEGRDGFLHGMLLAVPPTNVLADGIQAGVPVPAVVAGAARVTKLRAVAVMEDARGQGLGATLIKRTVRTGHWVGERAATDLLALARKGRAFDSLGTVTTRQGGRQVLFGTALAVTAALRAGHGSPALRCRTWPEPSFADQT